MYFWCSAPSAAGEDPEESCFTSIMGARPRKLVNRRSQGRPPDFLTIGAEKAGTTWLHQQLAGHPSIRTPPMKELNYFNAIDLGVDCSTTIGSTGKWRRELRYRLLHDLRRLDDAGFRLDPYEAEPYGHAVGIAVGATT